jgi:hypothetical protein
MRDWEGNTPVKRRSSSEAASRRTQILILAAFMLILGVWMLATGTQAAHIGAATIAFVVALVFFAQAWSAGPG